MDRGPALQRPAGLGGRLPAERTLAEQLQVSRTSVREAIRVLEAMGVLRAGVGSGPEAGTVVIADPTAALGSALRLHVATSHLPVKDIVETRVLLESWAASRASPESRRSARRPGCWSRWRAAPGRRHSWPSMSASTSRWLTLRATPWSVP
ncbi:FadR/GntR family transcriptional regulator [Pseudarthrobacter sp. So.54]